MDVPSNKYYTYFEYAAAKLYYEDCRLHLLLDQVDSGLYLDDVEYKWDVGIKNPLKNLNFHILWAQLASNKKEFYLNLAHHDLYHDKEFPTKEQNV